jgi:transcriptional regulator with XRE-family HTH domain
VTLSVDIEIHVGRRIRRRRRVLDLTQQQLGTRIGVRFQQIQRYECGASAITANRLWRLAEALEVPVSYFYEGLESAQGRTGDEMHPRSLFTQEG